MLRLIALLNRGYFIHILILIAAIQISFAKTDWPSLSFRTENFTVPYFDVTRSSLESTEKGFLFFGLEQPYRENLRGAFIADDIGELIWHGGLSFDAYYNFRTQTLKDQSVLSYWIGRTLGTHGYGSIKILDNTYCQIHEVCLPATELIVTPIPMPRRKCFIDKHESVITDRNTILVLAYNTTQFNLTAVGGPEEGWVYDCLFYELEIGTNRVLFRWSALDYVDITTSNYINKTGKNPLIFGDRQTGFHQRAPWDFFHINSVQAIPGGYLVNSRMTWSFYFVDGQTGAIDYTVEGSNGGDFALRDSIFFSWQHHARLQSISEDTSTLYVSLFNNDNIRGLIQNVNRSSGYLLAVNTTSKEVYQSRHIQDINPYRPPILSVAEGSYQALGRNHVLLGYGSEPFVQEFDASDNVIYTARYCEGTIDGIPSMHAYRVFRLPWDAQPKYPPKVFAVLSRISGSIQIWMSWNGATRYAGWNVFIGTSRETLQPVALNIVKRGFETSYAVQQKTFKHTHLLVQAIDGNGNILANSTIIKIAIRANLSLPHVWLGSDRGDLPSAIPPLVQQKVL